MTIGDRIRSRRLELGLSVDEVANRIGKFQSTHPRGVRRAMSWQRAAG